MSSIPHPSDDFEDRVSKAGDYAESWIFAEHGPVIVGELVRIDERMSDYGQLYPIVTLRRSNGEARSVHCYETALQGQLGDANPQIGERVGIRRHQDKKQSKVPGHADYYPFTLVVEGREGGAVDLKKYAGTAEPSDEQPIGEQPPPRVDDNGELLEGWQ